MYLKQKVTSVLMMIAGIFGIQYFLGVAQTKALTEQSTTSCMVGIFASLALGCTGAVMYYYFRSKHKSYNALEVLSEVAKKDNQQIT